MKRLKILHAYMKGIRLSAVILCIMFTWALFSGVIVYGKLQGIYSDVSVLGSTDKDRTGVLMYFPNEEAMKTRSYERYIRSVKELLEGESAVENVLAVRTVNPVSYNGEGISIVLYDPALLDVFPGLKRLGIDFSAVPDGCILGSTMFGDLNSGDTVELLVGNTKVSFPVAGRVSAPYRHFSLNQSSTVPKASYFFQEGDLLIMLDSPQLRDVLQNASIAWGQNLVVSFKEGTTQLQRTEILERCAAECRYYSIAQVLDGSFEEIQATMKEQLPIPLFVMVSALVAYSSILVLTLKKKESEMAVLHLCGMDRKSYGTMVFAASQAFTLIPCGLIVLLLEAWPRIQWDWTVLYKNGHQTVSDEIWSLLLHLYAFYRVTVINMHCLPLVLTFYGATVLICVGVTWFYMKRHTPLRGSQL